MITKLWGLLIAALLIWGLVDNIEYDDILLAEASAGSGVSIASLEDINQGRRMLTYKNKYQKRVEALNTRHDVRVIGTNYTWPFVMTHTLSSGSFFSQNDQTHRMRMAVLNEAAALEMFGNLDAVGNEIRIDSELYLVTGVLNDGTEELVVYIPAVILSSTANTVIMRLDDDFTRASAIGILSGAGVAQPRYSFTDYRLLRQIREERFLMALYCALLAGLMFILRRTFNLLTQKIRKAKATLSEVYIFEFWQRERLLIISIWGLALLGLIIVIIQFALILHAFEMLLVWHDVLI